MGTVNGKTALTRTPSLGVLVEQMSQVTISANRFFGNLSLFALMEVAALQTLSRLMVKQDHMTKGSPNVVFDGRLQVSQAGLLTKLIQARKHLT